MRFRKKFHRGGFKHKSRGRKRISRYGGSRGGIRM